MKELIGTLLAAIGGASSTSPRRRPRMRMALDNAKPTLTDPIAGAMEARMQEQAEAQGAALQQLEQALQQRLDRLEAAVGAKLQAQLITLAQLISEAMAAQLPTLRAPAAALVPQPHGIAGTPAEARRIDAITADGAAGMRERGR